MRADDGVATPAAPVTSLRWGVLDRAGRLTVVVLACGWVVVLGLILNHRIFVSHDTMINYAHVWYVSTRFWHGHGIPFRMPVIGHGQGLAFPYGFLPWFTGALLRPLLGDWVVTLWVVVGFTTIVAGTFFAFPEVRRGWWAAAVLANPALVAAVIIGQLPFMWGIGLFLVAIGFWRRNQRVAATVLTAVAGTTHPAVVLPIIAVIVAAWYRWERDRSALRRCYLISLAASLPATLLVFASPVFTDSSWQTKISNFFGTLAPRLFIVAIPVAMLLLRRTRRQWLAPAACLTLMSANFAVIGPLGTQFAWHALRRGPDHSVLRFLQSDEFQPGATYRMLRAGDGKIGMYQMIQRGARLDSEFFPEDIARHSWPTTVKYSRFLRRRHVDYVVTFDSYDRLYATNEHSLLDEMAKRHQSCTSKNVGVEAVVRTVRYNVYEITRDCED